MCSLLTEFFNWTMNVKISVRRMLLLKQPSIKRNAEDFSNVFVLWLPVDILPLVDFYWSNWDQKHTSCMVRSVTIVTKINISMNLLHVWQWSWITFHRLFVHKIINNGYYDNNSRWNSQCQGLNSSADWRAWLLSISITRKAI